MKPWIKRMEKDIPSMWHSKGSGAVSYQLLKEASNQHLKTTEVYTNGGPELSRQYSKHNTHETSVHSISKTPLDVKT